MLIDGHALVHRAFHAIREPLTVRRTGEQVSAVFGFLNMLLQGQRGLAPHPLRHRVRPAPPPPSGTPSTKNTRPIDRRRHRS